MKKAEIPTRDVGRTDGKRAIISVGALVVVFTVYWFLLPAIQSQIIPDAPGGAGGPWVFRPILAFHFGAVAVMACLTAPLITGPLRRRWTNEDAALGSRYDPFRRRPAQRALFLLRGGALLLIYAVSLMFYLLSWTRIGPEGIEQRLPWTRLRHDFGDVASLTTIPEGERSDSLKQNGPWYSIELRSGRTIILSLDNESTTPDELEAMATLVADRSGLSWGSRSDTRVR
jgi:hypothetical protein